MKESCECQRFKIFHPLNADRKKSQERSYSSLWNEESLIFDQFLFGMNCCLKELNH